MTDDYVRVFGDNDGTITDCRNCRARDSTTADDADETTEREVLLRDVNGEGSANGVDGGEDPPDAQDDPSDGAATTGGEREGTAERPAADTSRDAPAVEHDDQKAAENGATEDASDGRGGARARLTDLVSSLRG